MKQKIIRLSQKYSTELEKYLKHGRRTGLQSVLGLGRQAVRLGLETLDLARIHERALGALDLSRRKNGFVKRAGDFFTEASTPIEETHRFAQAAQVRLGRVLAALKRRTEELAASNQKLQRGLDRCRRLKAASDRNGDNYRKCLAASLQLQTRLRQLAHKVMANQEIERTKISHELQDEIAQTLLGINVRLLTLKAAVRNNTKGLKKEITSTQRLVVRSAQSVRQAARRIRNA